MSEIDEQNEEFKEQKNGKKEEEEEEEESLDWMPSEQEDALKDVEIAEHRELEFGLNTEEDKLDEENEQDEESQFASWYTEEETERERLIRLGKITPFADMEGYQRSRTAVNTGPSTTENVSFISSSVASSSSSSSTTDGTNPELLTVDEDQSTSSTPVIPMKPIPLFKRKMKKKPKLLPGMMQAKSPRSPALLSRDGMRTSLSSSNSSLSQSPRYSIPTVVSNTSTSSKKRLRKKKKKKNDDDDDENSIQELQELAREMYGDPKSTSPEKRITRQGNSRMGDDGTEEAYQRRLKDWEREKGKKSERSRPLNEENDASSSALWQESDSEDEMIDEENVNIERNAVNSEEEEEMEDDVEFEGGYRLPSSTYYQLYDFQQTGINWLWELFCLNTGGIIADEMGLGKTVQTCVFLGGLHYSGLVRKATLIVCPATMMNHWVRELHKWWPPYRVAVLHSSGSFTGSKKSIVNEIVKEKGVLITSYGTLLTTDKLLLKQDWQCVFLDEGHKIRNPDADITLACKQLKTPHRIILTGAPIQNNLVELWSLFDFIFPGKLGTLPIFKAQFVIPITMGGYANASRLQVQVAFKTASSLKEMINPYLLRRMKKDVNINLPSKTEQILFCPLQEEQQMLYLDYLASEDLRAVLEGKKNLLCALTYLRKICNHPDLVLPERQGKSSYGHFKRSGKLKVAEQLLRIWKSEGHKVLLFTQTRKMLDILERLACKQKYKYLRMDGTTSVASRQRLIDRYNSDEDFFLFLLTTRTGGVGVNLTSADRVLIYDPDWNPSTDSQARERAWRIGQKRSVVIFRLVTSGTVEEKIYQRQIYKEFLSKKVLQDPRQRRFFHSIMMRDLFSLDLGVANADGTRNTETGSIFSELDSEILPEDLLRREKDGRRQSGGVDGLNGRQQNGNEKRTRGRIEGLEEIEITGVDENEVDSDKEDVTDEKNVLAMLFSSKGIHSVLQHDSIVGQTSEEQLFLDNEANMIAKKAVELLKLSRRSCNQEKVYVPTWTGQSGTAGAPPPSSAPSSTEEESIDMERIQRQQEVRQKRFGAVKNASMLYMNETSSPTYTSSMPSSSSSPSSTTDSGVLDEKALQKIKRQQEVRQRRFGAISNPSIQYAQEISLSTSNSSTPKGDWIADSNSDNLRPSTPSSSSSASKNSRKRGKGTLGGKQSSKQRKTKSKSFASVTYSFEPPSLEDLRRSSATHQTLITDFLRKSSSLESRSSSSIIARVRSKDAIAGTTTEDCTLDCMQVSIADEDVLVDKVKQLHDFLESMGGSATTADIIAEFELHLEERGEKALFRSMLKNIAVFDKEMKKWVLKEEVADV